VNDTQCKEETTLAEGECTWIYLTNDSSTTNGICELKTTERYECEDLNRTSQCEDGAYITILKNQCGRYPEESSGDSDSDSKICKQLCEVITLNTKCEEDRVSDCFWLDENTTAEVKVEGKCVNRV
jgi:hypothetical protein